jgi:hypothetical protein
LCNGCGSRKELGLETLYLIGLNQSRHSLRRAAPEIPLIFDRTANGTVVPRRSYLEEATVELETKRFVSNVVRLLLPTSEMHGTCCAVGMMYGLQHADDDT